MIVWHCILSDAYHIHISVINPYFKHLSSFKSLPLLSQLVWLEQWYCIGWYQPGDLDTPPPSILEPENELIEEELVG